MAVETRPTLKNGFDNKFGDWGIQNKGDLVNQLDDIADSAALIKEDETIQGARTHESPIKFNNNQTASQIQFRSNNAPTIFWSRKPSGGVALQVFDNTNSTRLLKLTDAAKLTVSGDISSTAGVTLWDQSAGHIPDSAIQTDPSGTPLSGGSNITIDNNDNIDFDGLGGFTTDQLDEAPNPINKYFTDERAQDAVGTIMSGGGGASITYDDDNDTIAVKVDTSQSQLTQSISSPPTQTEVQNIQSKLNSLISDLTS